MTAVSKQERILTRVTPEVHTTLQRAAEITDSPHGKQYIIDGMLHAPIDKVIALRTVWMIDPGCVEPRFVTAYPLKR